MSSKVMARIDNPAFILGFFFKLYNCSSHDGVFKNKTHQICHDMAVQFISSCDFPKMTNTRQATMPKQSHKHIPMTSSPSFTMDVSPTVLREFFTQVHSISIGSEDLAGLLVEKLVACAPQIAGTELDSLWIPFLESVLPFLTMKKINASTPRYEQLFIAYFTGYVRKFVGHSPRQESSLKRRGVLCQCTDCGHLNNFLANATQKEGRFSVNRKRREHMYGELDCDRVDCTYMVERGKSPFTLVVTKTSKEWEKKYQEWSKRSSIARGKLNNFDQKKLRKLLGNEYQNVVDLKHSTAAHVGASLAALNEISPNGTSKNAHQRLGRAAGGKRKRAVEENEVVDLTSE
jgi:hypothetical protein